MRSISPQRARKPRATIASPRGGASAPAAASPASPAAPSRGRDDACPPGGIVLRDAARGRRARERRTGFPIGNPSATFRRLCACCIARRHRTPDGVSSSTIPCAASRSRMRSDSAKFLAFAGLPGGSRSGLRSRDREAPRAFVAMTPKTRVECGRASLEELGRAVRRELVPVESRVRLADQAEQRARAPR